MANRETKLTIVVDAQNKASAGLSAVAGSLKGMGNTLENVASGLQTIGKYGAIGFAAVSAEIYKSVQAASEAAKVDAQLEAVLKSTSHAAGLFTEDLEEQAKALARLTTFDDEAIKSTEAHLLTFTNVKGPVFQESIGTILDMSVALGQDLKSSAIQVGKALQDPIDGVNALRRVGVNFSEEQRQVIATLVETGKVAEAQRFILKELNTEFGGSAQAQAATYGGQLEQLKNRFGDLQEAIGSAVIPVLQQLLDKVAPILERVIAWVEQNPQLTLGIIAIAAAVTGLLVALGALGLLLSGVIALFTALGITGTLVIANIAAIGLAIYNFVKIMDLLQQHWVEVWLGIKLTVAEVVNGIVKLFEGLINKIIGGLNFLVQKVNALTQKLSSLPMIGGQFKRLKISEFADVSFGGIDTDAMAANTKIPSLANPMPVIQIANNVLLSEDSAERMGDLIMQKLKLSNAL